MQYERFIGTRHLTSGRQRFLNMLTMLAIVGVAVGVTALTSIMSVTGGFIDVFRDRVLGVNPHLVVTRYGVFFSDYEVLQDAIDQVPGVEATAPFVIREMLATAPGSKARPGVLVKGVSLDSLLANEDIEHMLTAGTLTDLRYEGDLATDSNPNGKPAAVAVGKVLAEKLGVGVGDQITLVSPLRGLRSIGVTGESAGANYAPFRVGAIVNSGFYDYDNRLIVMDYRAVQDMLDLGDVVMGIEVRIADVDQTLEIKERVAGAITTGRFKVLDWREINRNLFASLELQKLVLTAIMGLLVFVSAVVMFCVLVMFVLEKRRDIAILRSLGASSGGIMRIFIFEGMTIGTIGVTLGLFGGVVVCKILQMVDFGLQFEVYRVDALPVTMRPLEFAAAAAGALAMAFFSSIIPAWRASLVSPADALRYD